MNEAFRCVFSFFKYSYNLICVTLLYSHLLFTSVSRVCSKGVGTFPCTVFTNTVENKLNQHGDHESSFLFHFDDSYQSTRLPPQHIRQPSVSLRRFDKIGFCDGSHSCCVKHGTLNTPKEKHNAVLTRLFKIVAMIIPRWITSAKSIKASALKTNIDVCDHTALSELFSFPPQPLEVDNKVLLVISDCYGFVLTLSVQTVIPLVLTVHFDKHLQISENTFQ